MTWRGLEDFGGFQRVQGFGAQSMSTEHKEGESEIDCQRGEGGGVISILQSLKGGEIK